MKNVPNFRLMQSRVTSFVITDSQVDRALVGMASEGISLLSVRERLQAAADSKLMEYDFKLMKSGVGYDEHAGAEKPLATGVCCLCDAPLTVCRAPGAPTLRGELQSCAYGTVYTLWAKPRGSDAAQVGDWELAGWAFYDPVIDGTRRVVTA